MVTRSVEIRDALFWNDAAGSRQTGGGRYVTRNRSSRSQHLERRKTFTGTRCDASERRVTVSHVEAFRTRLEVPPCDSTLPVTQLLRC